MSRLSENEVARRLSSVEAPGPPPELLAKIQEEIPRDLAAVPPDEGAGGAAPNSRRPWWIAAAAVLAVALGGGWLAVRVEQLQVDQDRFGKAPAMEAKIEAETPARGTAAEELAAQEMPVPPAAQAAAGKPALGGEAPAAVRGLPQPDDAADLPEQELSRVADVLEEEARNLRAQSEALARQREMQAELREHVNQLREENASAEERSPAEAVDAEMAFPAPGEEGESSGIVQDEASRDLDAFHDEGARSATGTADDERALKSELGKTTAAGRAAPAPRTAPAEQPMARRLEEPPERRRLPAAPPSAPAPEPLRKREEPESEVAEEAAGSEQSKLKQVEEPELAFQQYAPILPGADAETEKEVEPDPRSNLAFVQNVLAQGQIPSAAEVEGQQLVNSFDFESLPSSGALSLRTEGAPSPLAGRSNVYLLRVSVASGSAEALARAAPGARLHLELSGSAVARHRLLGTAAGGLEDPLADAALTALPEVTALYELELAPGFAAFGKIANVRFSYRGEPGERGERSLERAVHRADFATSWESSSPGFRLAALVAAFADELEKPSPDPALLEDLERLARGLRAAMPGDPGLGEVLEMMGDALAVEP